MTGPILSGDAQAAVRHCGSHLQVIASAGFGKTEMVAQRFAELIADGADPAGIIAFKFTERAAQELKARISARVEERLGAVALERLRAAFVGTIHAYCFRLLQQHVARYETLDVLDERRLTAFLCREEPALGRRVCHPQCPAARRSKCAGTGVITAHHWGYVQS
jgi:DNA helicase-2/ATP-dependent DNA helicase PcrA